MIGGILDFAMDIAQAANKKAARNQSGTVRVQRQEPYQNSSVHKAGYSGNDENSSSTRFPGSESVGINFGDSSNENIVIDLGGKNALQGMIYSEILGKPRCKRGRRWRT